MERQDMSKSDTDKIGWGFSCILSYLQIPQKQQNQQQSLKTGHISM